MSWYDQITKKFKRFYGHPREVELFLQTFKVGFLYGKRNFLNDLKLLQEEGQFMDPYILLHIL